MDKNIILVIIGLCVLGLFSWAFLGITDCDSVFGKCNVSGNQGEKQVSETSVLDSLPEGYTLDSYTIEKVTDVSCNQDSDCETPAEYLSRSVCPFVSLCLQDKCTIVCPDLETIEFLGQITDIVPEMDGLTITLENNGTVYEAVVSIPNLGPDFAPAMKEIELGKSILIIGNKIRLGDKYRLIASQIYLQ